MTVETVLLAVVLIAGLYMAWNIGANDVANAMGTSVGSGALTLAQAVLIAAIFEFSGAFFFGSHVSKTMQSGIVYPELYADAPLIMVYGMLAALLASGIWLQIASYFGWPVSTTHSIVGAIVGFGIISGGNEAVNWDNVGFIVSSWVFSPLLGGCLSYLMFNLLRRNIFYDRHPFEAAKKLTPWLVFFAALIMSLMLLLEGLQHSFPELTSWHALVISVVFAALAALVSFFAMRRLQSHPARPKAKPPYGPEIAVELDKAKRHLTRVQDSAQGDLHYYVSLLIEEVDGVAESLKKIPEQGPEVSEYDAVEKIFARLQIASASLMAFAHGTNDVANAIGPLSASIAILSTGTIEPATPIPTWLLGFGGFGIVVGLATWGWRVIETIGKKITELTASRGFTAELSAATIIVLASRLGMPISTTHTLVGAVLGVAFARGIGALNLSTTRDIVLSWIVTVPAGAVLSIGIFLIIRAIFG